MAKLFQSKKIVTDNPEELSRGQKGSGASMGEVQQVYNELTTIEKPSSSGMAVRSLLVLAIGLCSGIVGALLIFGDVFGITNRLVRFQDGQMGRTIILERRERVDVPWEESKEKIFQQISKSVHAVFKLKAITDSNEITKGIYFQEDQVGTALSLSSDGWLVTTASVVKERASYGVLVAGRVFSVEKVIQDPYTGLSFLKLKIQNLQPVRFANSEPNLGTVGVVGSASLNGFRGDLVGLTDIEVRTISSKSPYESSERNSTFIGFELPAKVLAGAGAFDVSGGLYGVYDGEYGFIDAERIERILSMVLKGSSVQIAFLGVTTLDLGALGIDQRVPTLPLYGARIQSILTGSPAQAAKFQVGDVILKVEEEMIGENKSLASLIQEYQPGTTVSLEILRNTDTMNVSVTLGKQ